MTLKKLGKQDIKLFNRMRAVGLLPPKDEFTPAFFYDTVKHKARLARRQDYKDVQYEAVDLKTLRASINGLIALEGEEPMEFPQRGEKF